MIQAGIFSLLSQNTSISALIGSRIYPVLLPEDSTLPAMTYHVIGGASMPTLSTSGMQRMRMQFDCWGQTYDDAATLRSTLISALNGYQGTLSDGTNLQFAQLIGPGTDFFEDAPRQFRCMCEFYLFFNFNF